MYYVLCIIYYISVPYATSEATKEPQGFCGCEQCLCDAFGPSNSIWHSGLLYLSWRQIFFLLCRQRQMRLLSFSCREIVQFPGVALSRFLQKGWILKSPSAALLSQVISAQTTLLWWISSPSGENQMETGIQNYHEISPHRGIAVFSSLGFVLLLIPLEWLKSQK